MAQAFKISRGNRTAHPGPLRDWLASATQGTQQRFPDRRPGPIPWPDRLLEYGSALGSPQALSCLESLPGLTRDRPDSRFGYPGQG